MKKGTAIIGAGLATVGIIVLVSRAKAAPPPPEGYVCPYCGESFDTYEEQVAHIQSVHIGERIPITITWE